jgi:hypothetical protein
LFIGKKNTKIYKAEHIPSGKIYAIKEVEAKTLEKLNEYKVKSIFHKFFDRKKQCSCLKCKVIQMYYSFMATISMKLCIIHSGLLWCANTWRVDLILSTFSEKESSKGCFGRGMKWRK